METPNEEVARHIYGSKDNFMNIPMNFHLYASMQNYEAEDFSPTSSLLSSAPQSFKSLRSSTSQSSARRAYNTIRTRCHRIKVRLQKPWHHTRRQDEGGDTTCDEFEFPYPSPLTFNFGTMQYEAAPAIDNDDDWYTTLATTLRRGYLEYDNFA